ncbi:MAG: hypothetical protein WAV20_05235 [Blastocatellia bacterium]
MTGFHSRLRLGVLSTITVITLVGPATLVGQNRRPHPTPPVKPPTTESAPTPPSPRTADQANMEIGILMSSRSYEAGSERERRRLAAQLTQDLARLEQLNTEKIAPLSSAKSFEYASLAHTSSEISDRAKRIKFNNPLALRYRQGEKIRYEADESQLPSMLPLLSKTIASFLASPVFRLSAPNDAELRAAAARDLDGIIKLSDTISKIAKRLSKTMAIRK